MGRIGKILNYLRKDFILSINKRLKSSSNSLYSEGKNNLLHESKLDYILEAIQYPIFQRDLYPTLYEKAAALCWFIIKYHIFFDGNKRTGILSAIHFLEVNGYGFNVDIEIIPNTISIANEEISFEEFCCWLKSKSFESDEFSKDEWKLEPVDDLVSRVIE